MTKLTEPTNLPSGVLDALPAGRIRKTAAYGMLALTTGTAVATRVRQLRSRFEWSVTVEATDDIYPDLHRWVLERIPEHRRRAVTAVTRTDGHDSPVSDTPRKVEPLKYRYDSTRPQTMQVDGQRIRVEIEREDISPVTRTAKERIRFTAQSVAGQRAIVGLLEGVVQERATIGRKPNLRIANRWGNWDRRNDLPPRSLDTVALPTGQRDLLVNDLTRFFANERHYARLGTPWHRGYLFHGPPGSGKTSIARALSTEFGLDVSYICLSDLETDTSLLGLVREIPARSLLLLEDIDVVDAARERDSEQAGISMAGLLNALDGVITPHGLVTIMTTNHRAAIDPAVIRPGRVDLDVHIGYVTDGQVNDLFRIAYGQDPTRPLAAAPDQVAAQVSEVLRRHPDDPGGAEAELRVTGRVATYANLKVGVDA